jgi:carboxypeptidase Taq
MVVHWPAGMLGYFPSYSLGAMMAAQQWAAIAKAMPDIEADLAEGRFERVNDWRRENIWSQGSRWSTPELMRRATGSTVDATHFKRHLEQRYG